MTKEMLSILKALQSGRKLIRNANKVTLKWEDNNKAPSLNDIHISKLFRANMITPEYQKGVRHTSDNATGYIILTEIGKLIARNKQ